MLTPEEVESVALELLAQRRLTKRQYDCWYAYRRLGLSAREAAEWLKCQELYDISYVTVIFDSRYAHEIVVQACEEAEEGKVRYEHSVHGGSEVWDVADTTLQDVAYKVKEVHLPKKKERNEPHSAHFSYFSA